MRVTVCEWPDQRSSLGEVWQHLAEHVGGVGSELVLLPEMPFSPWLAGRSSFDGDVWMRAAAAHDAWERRFPELGGAVVLGTRPVQFGNQRYNSAFVWDRQLGSRSAHAKSFASEAAEGAAAGGWYHPAPAEFTPIEVGPVSVGFLIETELWAMEEARAYGLEGVQLLATPRRTLAQQAERWIAAGRVAAVLAGAFGLSSSRVAQDGSVGGPGWILSPDGETLALTSAAQPFVTASIDLSAADRAKQTYPRSIFREPQGSAPRPPIAPSDRPPAS